MKKSVMLTCTIAGAAALLLNSGAARATLPDLQLCQATIELETNKFNDAVAKALRLCSDAVRKEQVKDAAAIAKGKPIGNTTAVAAKLCELKLRNVYDVFNVKPGKSSVDKFRAKIDKLFAPPAPAIPKCDPSFMTKYGHLPSPGAAPGLATQEFMENSLLASSDSAAINQAVAQIGDVIGLINAAQKAPSSKFPCTSAANCATECSNSLDLGFRPNLCAFGVQCVEHACNLATGVGGSNATIATAGVLGTVSTALAGRLALGICVLSHQGTGFGATPGFQYTIGGPSRTLNQVVLGGGVSVCVSVNRTEGWCDCNAAGASIPKNTNLCQDRILDPAELTAGTDGCGQPTSLATDDTQGNGGTKVGQAGVNLTGTSTAGDCLSLFTTQFTVFQAACTGIANDPCGNDHVACTSDDRVAPQAPATVPLTTGTAVASVQQAVSSPGGCDGDGGTTSCIEDRNCSACVNGLCPDGATACTTDATCAAAPGGPCNDPAPGLTTITVGPLTGTKTNCVNYDASNMSGLSFVGAFPSASGDPPLGDNATAFKLSCL